MQAGTSLKSSIHTTYSRVAHTRGSGSIDVLLTRCRAHAAPLFQAHHLALAVDASLGAATAAPCEIRRPSLSAPTVPPTGTDNGAIRDADLHNKPSVSGPMNPARLAALSQLLRMPLKMVERLLERNPRLLQITPDGLQLQLEQLSRELRLPQRTITAMFCKQPGLLAHTPAADVRIRAEALASELRVPPADVVQWARRIPVVLRRHPSVVRRRLKRLAELYGVEVKAMAQMASEAPQYLTDSYTSIQSRLQAMCKMLHRPQRLVVRMLQRQPDLVFISPRVLANKLKVLQAILNKDHRHIVTLVMRTPKLLRSPLDAVRATFKGLPGLMGLQEGVVYAMACHEPALLLEPLPALTQRLRRIRRATQASSTWAQEWKKMNPAQLADCLLVTNVTYQRLDFLAAQKQGPSLGLRDALMMARTDFAKRWPEFEVKLQQQAAAAAAAAAGSAVPFARYASPGAGRYMSPLVPSTMQQQQQRGVSSVSSGPPSSSASSYQAVGPVLNQPSSNARFKSPMRAAGGYAAAAAPPPLSVPMAAGVSPTGAASMYAQQALLAQQQQMMAQQMQEQFAAQYGQVMSGGSPGRSPGAEPPEGLPYSRKPRPVDYQPYDIKDFEDKEYNIKKAGKGYWELGRLGPDLETEELQAKREKQERIKQLAAQVREDNAKKQVQAAAKPAAPKPKEPSAREKALMFAKNIPKPEPPKPSASPDAAAAAAAAAGPGRTSPGPTRGPAAGKGPGQGAAKPVAAPGSELERLEAQHNQDQARVEAIRAELARLMK